MIKTSIKGIDSNHLANFSLKIEGENITTADNKNRYTNSFLATKNPTASVKFVLLQINSIELNAV